MHFEGSMDCQKFRVVLHLLVVCDCALIAVTEAIFLLDEEMGLLGNVALPIEHGRVY